MKVLIKNARILQPEGKYHLTSQDLLIIDGFIQQIDACIEEKADKIISKNNLHLSIGWMDIFSHFCDPGEEDRETLITGTAAAAAGGFTDVMLIPDSRPTVTSKAHVEYLMHASHSLSASIHPIGGVTKNLEGLELADMYELLESGCVACSDGLHSIQNSGLLLKALQYLKKTGRPLIQIPDDHSILPNGLMHEGISSVRLGLSARPAIAEELMIARDIEILRYTGSQLHITGISTAKGIELIRAAKAEGLNLTCSATPYHVHFTDEELEGYDTRLKVNPPLRSKDDCMALRQALQDGTIDCPASHHIPVHKDNKWCEFEKATPGMCGLESLFGAINSFHQNLSDLIRQMTATPRKIFGINMPQIEEGAPARLTLFDPEKEFVFESSMIRSSSGNNAFVGKKLKGKVYATIIGDKINEIL